MPTAGAPGAGPEVGPASDSHRSGGGVSTASALLAAGAVVAGIALVALVVHRVRRAGGVVARVEAVSAAPATLANVEVATRGASGRPSRAGRKAFVDGGVVVGSSVAHEGPSAADGRLPLSV